ncbi:unnamed protein product [Dovyalis caffra]|uniref:Uncharacterized protein n=1 Tax=Dovyalis caffra TaxID=77055 RepID=A0AAV1R9P1_9ROSI|nr:unnamed protein product [Dovyalis caffra]
MALSLQKTWRSLFSSSRLPSILPSAAREFRSDAALEAILKANEEKTPNIVLYNYPSFSGAFSALFAHLFHTRFNLPCLILPFSSVEPFRIEDFKIEGLERCYLLDFIGPHGFASTLSRQSNSEVICFDHRKSVLSRVQSKEDCGEKGEIAGLLNPEDHVRVELVLKYIEDMDLRRWSLPDIRAFKVGISEWLSKFNCVTNPYMFEQLLEISSVNLIEKGNSYISSRWAAASKLLDKVFKVQLGQGFYGECLGVRADGNSHLGDEIGKQLSVKSAAAGLRPIGAVVYVQRNNLKMCLRSTDVATDTSEVAKVVYFD